MNDLTQLTEAEIAAVAGGFQSISITATQTNSSSVDQSATASNYGNVSATAGPYSTAAAAGAEANNTAIVFQSNSIRATNVFRRH